MDIPKKHQYPGSFLIPCYLGDAYFNNCLADLGASINLIPFYIYEKLYLGILKPTRICIQLADWPSAN